MTAFGSAGLILAVRVAAYLAAKLLRLSAELSILAAALAGALAGGAGLPARHIAEGAFTYFDIILIFITATLFMNLLKEAGGVAFAVRRVLCRFHRRKAVLFSLLALLLLIPGGLTGAGSVTVPFLTDYSVVDRIIDHLKLTFVAERPPPPQAVSQKPLMAADVSAEYFL